MTKMFIIFMALLCTGCAGLPTYFKDRALDLTDILDPKFGFGKHSLGLGAKLEATEYLGVGLGFGVGYDTSEYYGRKVDRDVDMFAHALLIGMDGPATRCLTDRANFNILFTSHRRWRPPWVGRFRLGGEAVLPFITFGLYANLGEVLDFGAGILGFDPAGDDGMPKGTEIEHEPIDLSNSSVLPEFVESR